ncbi:PREDICTED: titin homolog isoform X1 [Rhagoletis zephyria]|uniref:titin homolog isoform X1 n=1 Tax=Rhagoletis zephyria TaxID=28612 RepID=UPI000811A1F7|nr:PREDICTED: titin homolog isoform X1 [Rhagoletis zephyria]
MDEIEYLEEYEDLILPTMSSHSAATKSRATSNVASMAEDEDSSSIDQDIFESLFDDHSDDESIMQKKVPAKLSQRGERISQMSRISMDSIDLLVKDLGEPLNADGSKAANKPTPKPSNTKITQPSKITQKAPTTTTANIKSTGTPTPASADNNKMSNKSEATERNSKTKSVATVRPTVQQSSAPTPSKQTNENSNDSTTNRAPPTSTSGHKSSAKVTSGAQNSSKRTPTPTTASTSRKQISAPTSTTASTSSAPGSSKSTASVVAAPPKRTIERSQTTIIKPEKPQSKDPAEDPLSLENIENESDSDTDSFIYSDISADTFVSLSDVDDEERQVIELSNDSNYDRANLDKIRGSTPSPTVSDDYKSDNEDSPAKMSSKRFEKSKHGSALDRNAAKKLNVQQYIDTQPSTSSHRKLTTPNSSKEKTKKTGKSPNTSDTLLERIDTVLSEVVDKDDDEQLTVKKQITDVELDVEVESNNQEESKEVSDHTVECSGNMDDTAITAPEANQEPSKSNSMDMEMEEKVEVEVIEQQNNELKTVVEAKAEERVEEMSDNVNVSDEAEISKSPDIDKDVAIMDVEEKAVVESLLSKNIDDSKNSECEVLTVETSEEVVELDNNVDLSESVEINQSEVVSKAENTEETKKHEDTEDNTADRSGTPHAHSKKTQEGNEDGVKLNNTLDEVNNQEELSDENPEEKENTDELRVEIISHEETGEKYNDESEKDGQFVDEGEVGSSIKLTERDKEKDQPVVHLENEKNEELKETDEELEESSKESEKPERGKLDPVQNESPITDEKTELEKKDESTDSTKNSKETQNEKDRKLETPSKTRISERETRSRTPLKAKETEKKPQNVHTEAKEKSSEIDTAKDEIKTPHSKTPSTSESTSGAEPKTKDPKAGIPVAKQPKKDEHLAKGNTKEIVERSLPSRSSNKQKIESKMEDPGVEKVTTNVDEAKSNSQKAAGSLTVDTNSKLEKKNEADERSQTQQGRKSTRATNVVKSPAEHETKKSESLVIPKITTDDDKTADNNTGAAKKDTTIKSNEGNSEGHKRSDNTNADQQSASATSTPKPDKRIRGLVVSLKKTDLSKVLNEKLLQTNEKFAGKAEADSKIGSFEDKAKEESKESTKPKRDSKDERTADRAKQDSKDDRTADREKKDSKDDRAADRAKSDSKEARSADRGKRDSKEERSSDRSRRDMKDDRSSDRARRDLKDERSADRSRRGLRDDKSYRGWKDERYAHRSRRDLKDERSDREKRYMRGEKYEDRSRRDYRDGRSTDRAKRETRDDRTRSRSSRDSRERRFTDRTKGSSRDNRSKDSNKRDTREDRSANRAKNDVKDEKPSDKSNKNTKNEIPADKAKKDVKVEKSADTSKVAYGKSVDQPTSKEMGKVVRNLEKELRSVSAAEEKSTPQRKEKEKKQDLTKQKTTAIAKSIEGKKEEEKTASTTNIASKALNAKMLEKQTVSGKGKNTEEREDEQPTSSTADLVEEQMQVADEVAEEISQISCENDEKKITGSGNVEHEEAIKERTREEKATENVSEGNAANENPDRIQTEGTEIDLENESRREIQAESVDAIALPEGAELTKRINLQPEGIDKNKVSPQAENESTSEANNAEAERSSRRKNAKNYTETGENNQRKDVDSKNFTQSEERPVGTKEKAMMEGSIEVEAQKIEHRTAVESSTGTENDELTASTDKAVDISESSYNAPENEDMAASTDKTEISPGTENEDVEVIADKTVVISESSDKAPENEDVAAKTDTTESSAGTKNEDGSDKTVAISESSVKPSEKDDVIGRTDKTDITESSVKTEEDVVESSGTAKEVKLKAKTVAKSSGKANENKAKTQVVIQSSTLALHEVTEQEKSLEHEAEALTESTDKHVALEETGSNKNSVDEVEVVVVSESTEKNIKDTTEVGEVGESAKSSSDEKTAAKSATESSDKLSYEKPKTDYLTKEADASSDKQAERDEKTINKTTVTDTSNEDVTEHDNTTRELRKRENEPKQGEQIANKTECNKGEMPERNTQEQTPSSRGNAESEKEVEEVHNEVSRSLRTRLTRSQAETQSPSRSPATPQTQSASEEEHEGSTRRSLRKRAADHSPSSSNELIKKGAKGRNTNQPPTSTALTTIAQKLVRESLNISISRSSSATPASAATRKRARDLKPSTTAEVNDIEKSPGKKLKLDSLRKCTRIHNDDVDTSDGELDAAIAQRRSRLPGGKESLANRSAQEKSLKSVGVKETPTNKSTTGSSERKPTQPSKQSAAAEIRETPITRTKDKPTKLQNSIAAESNKRRSKPELDNVQQPKKFASSNEDLAVTQKPAGSTTAATASQRPEAKFEIEHATPGSDAVDPLEIPVKRIRRLHAIDGYEATNVAEERKAEELEKKNLAPTRKSLRAGGQADTAKDESNKMQTKQQQQQRVARSGEITAETSKNKQATNNASKQSVKGEGNEAGKSAVPVDKGNTSTSKANGVSKSQASPTKSPGSKVITFKEWLEQQKRGSGDNGESAQPGTVEGPDTTTADVATAVAADTAKSSEEVVSAEKDVKYSASIREVRDASRKRKDVVPPASKETRGTIETTKETPTASRQDASEKASPTKGTNTPTQFKRPSLPQRSARATPVARGISRTLTPGGNRKNLNSTPQSGRQLALQKVGNKWKLRKLRVRINRSIVAAYLKKHTLNKAKTQVKYVADEKRISSLRSVATTAVPEDVHPPSDAAQKASRQKTVTITQKRVALKTPAASLAQLPPLTARPTVAAEAAAVTSSVGKGDQTRLTNVLPKLTKVPSVLEKDPLESQNEQQISPTADAGYQQDSPEELSLLTPMKSVAVTSTHTTTNSRVQQQKQQSGITAAEAMREKRVSASSSTDSCSTQRSMPIGAKASGNSSASNAATSFTPVVPKEELVDDQQQQTQQSTPSRAVAAVSADNSAMTNSLASRTLAIAAATNSALNQTPSGDPSGYYGLTPTQLDSNGTRLYSFLHPAKYNRNHGCVLLDYCCPNLDGPMPAIDPTRIHAQVQAGVRELPAYIVMTTKLITRADLEANKNVIPASIRQKVEKITADSSNASANQSALAVVSGTPNVSMSIPSTPQITPGSKPSLTPTITALQKHLPSTTIITPKLLPAASTSGLASPLNSLNSSTQGGTVTTTSLLMSDYQRSLLRTSVRQFDARLKKYYYRVAMLSFSDRQIIIDNIINSTSLTPKDVECAVRLLDEYASQINLLPSASALGTPKPTTPQAMQSISKAITTPTTNTAARTSTMPQQIQKQHQNQPNSTGQIAVLDKDNSLLGYQITSSASTLSKSTVSTRSSIMSTTTKNTSLPHVKAAQDSPRIFYTKPPMQTSTPIATTNSSGTAPQSGVKTVSLRSTPRMGREVTIRQMPTKLGSISSRTPTTTATPPSTRRFPTITRNPHLTTSNTTPTSTSVVNTTVTSDTITTRSAVTISTAPKRMTRASAAAKVIVITQNNEGDNTALDECILPDGNNSTEIKREKVDDDFVGGN